MLIDFYKRVLLSLGLHVTEDGFIKTSNDNTGILVTEDGKPLVLPEREHINSLYDTDEDGKTIITKIPYNPLNENVIKGDTLSLKRTKTIVEARLGLSVCLTGGLLLSLSTTKDLQKKTSIEVNEFLASLNQAMGTGATAPVDDKSIESWQRIYAASMKSEKGLLTIFLKKSGVLNGVKYNRLATMACNLYDELLVADKNTPVYGIKLRPKDIIVFKLIIEYLIPGIKETGVVSVGSNDKEAPGFISLYSMFITVGKVIMPVLKELAFVNQEYTDKGYLDITITEEELKHLSKYKSELITIPNEVDLSRQKANVKMVVPDINGNLTRNVGNVPQVAQNQQLYTNQQPQQYYQPVQEIAQYQPAPDPYAGDPMSKVLYGNTNNNMGYQQPMQPPQQFITKADYQNAMMNQQPQQFVGNNGFMHNNYQQPVSMGVSSIVNNGMNRFNQPVYQQPMQNNGFNGVPFDQPFNTRIY